MEDLFDYLVDQAAAAEDDDGLCEADDWAVTRACG
jgi:hypothetical protein